MRQERESQELHSICIAPPNWIPCSRPLSLQALFPAHQKIRRAPSAGHTAPSSSCYLELNLISSRGKNFPTLLPLEKERERKREGKKERAPEFKSSFTHAKPHHHHHHHLEKDAAAVRKKGGQEKKKRRRKRKRETKKKNSNKSQLECEISRLSLSLDGLH